MWLLDCLVLIIVVLLSSLVWVLYRYLQLDKKLQDHDNRLQGLTKTLGTKAMKATRTTASQTELEVKLYLSPHGCLAPRLLFLCEQQVGEVKALHVVLEDSDADDFDRAAAAFLLTALYGRCRASDLVCIDWIEHDHSDRGGCIELFAAVHKTGRSAVKKTTLLPILVPAGGINGKNWAVSAHDAFYRIGLCFSGSVQGPLLRPPSHQGPFLCQRGVIYAEIGKLLRGLIALDAGQFHM
eukprot:s118_g43.t1